MAMLRLNRAITYSLLISGFLPVPENLENNELIFQVLETSLNFQNQEMSLKNTACEKIHLEQKSL